MKFTIQVLIEGADALPLTVPIQTIDRAGGRIEEIGLQTVEAKSILEGLQQVLLNPSTLGTLMPSARQGPLPSQTQPRHSTLEWEASIPFPIVTSSIPPAHASSRPL
jgi:hypothetical protein